MRIEAECERDDVLDVQLVDRLRSGGADRRIDEEDDAGIRRLSLGGASSERADPVAVDEKPTAVTSSFAAAAICWKSLAAVTPAGSSCG